MSKLKAYLAKNRPRVSAARTLTAIHNMANPVQLALLEDNSRRIAVRCPRRSGKTVALMLRILKLMVSKPGSKVLYLCLTSIQADKNLGKPIRELNDKLKLGGKYVGGGTGGNEARYTLPNGSTLWLRGGETAAEMEKNRGQFYDLVAIDEGKSFSDDVLVPAIDDVLWPSLMDTLGTLIMIGTPGEFLNGLFYEATTVAPGWSRHSWSQQDNIAMPHIWEEAKATKLKSEWPDDHPTWLREYLGQWCPDPNKVVFSSFDSTRNVSKHTPDKDWEYMLGIGDVGAERWSIVVTGYSPYEGVMHVVSAREVLGTLDDLAGEVDSDLSTYSPGGVTYCGSWLLESAVRTLSDRFSLAVEYVKPEERGLAALINTDLASSKLVVPPKSPILREWSHLRWDLKTQRIEDTRDAIFTYGLMGIQSISHHFDLLSKENRPKPGTDAYIKAELERQEHEAAHPGLSKDDMDLINFDYDESTYT